LCTTKQVQLIAVIYNTSNQKVRYHHGINEYFVCWLRRTTQKYPMISHNWYYNTVPPAKQLLTLLLTDRVYLCAYHDFRI